MDIDGDLSAGIRVYPGHLDLETILSLTKEPAYAKRATQIRKDENGKLIFVGVTFSNDATAEPALAEAPYEGFLFDDETPGKGKLSYEASFSEMSSVEADTADADDAEFEAEVNAMWNPDGSRSRFDDVDK